MSKLNFFTPITYKNTNSTNILEKIDGFCSSSLYLGGKKAVVIQGHTKNGQKKVVLYESKVTVLAIAKTILACCTIVIPLLKLIVRAILLSNHSFKVIIPRQKLEKGMNISKDIAAKIKELMPKILAQKTDDEIEWLSTGDNLVFKLNQHPEFVFKIPRANSFRQNKLPTIMDNKNKINSRFENMVKAKEVCMINELGLLIIPHAKKMTVNVEGNDYDFIVEECLDLNFSESIQKENYHTYSKNLNETVRQLATFVAKTGFNDVTWRNIPILNEISKMNSHKRVALIDLEHMESAVNGFIGDAHKHSDGLIGCVSSKEQMNIVITEAHKQGVAINEVLTNNIKERRLQQLESDKKLSIFYKKKGIVTGKEPIQVDIESLGLNLNEESQIHIPLLKIHKQPITLRKVTEDVITSLNELIQNKSDQESRQEKRYLILDNKTHFFDLYRNLGLPVDKIFINKEEENQQWLRRIIHALIDKGHIFNLKANGYSLCIQA